MRAAVCSFGAHGRFFLQSCRWPIPPSIPVILLSPVEGGYVAYDPALDQLHQLNPVAALLTELCDGSRSVEEIRALVGSAGAGRRTQPASTAGSMTA